MEQVINIGEKINKLTILAYLGKTKDYRKLVLCKCECGNEKVIQYKYLKNGHTKSCGCYQREQTSKAKRTHGEGGKTTEYKSFSGMKTRCYNTNERSYKDYGGRGITVCDRWLHSFENFLADMGRKPTPQHSIDRIDVNGNYEPSNCRWATDNMQRRNKRNNVWLEAGGKKMILSEWAKYWGVYVDTIRFHIKKNKSFDYIFNYFNDKIKNKKVHPMAKYSNSKVVVCTETGKMWGCVKDASIELGINYCTLISWLSNNRKNTTTLKYLD